MVADSLDIARRQANPAGFAVSAGWDRDEAYRFVEDLFARHQNEIYAYLVRMLRDPELAADLTQDAFVKAYRAYDSLQKPENARAWLYQIAHRVALDNLRRRRIVRFVPLVGETRNTSPSAEHLAMDLRLSGDLQRALEKIPERQRAALLLAELHDLTRPRARRRARRVPCRRPRAPHPGSREPPPGARRRAGSHRGERGRSRRRPPPGDPVVSPLFRRASADHDRARELAALRVDEPLEPADAAWLDAHLDACDACAAVAADYDTDRLLFAALRDASPQPPRDLWARTAAAIDAEPGQRRPAASRGRRVLGVPAASLAPIAGLAVVAIVVGSALASLAPIAGLAVVAIVVGSTLLNGSPVVPPPDGSPVPTAIAVTTDDIAVLARNADGSFEVRTAGVDEICPLAADSCAVAEPSFEAAQVARISAGAEVDDAIISPARDSMVIVGRDASGTNGLYVVPVKPAVAVTSTPTPATGPRPHPRSRPRPHPTAPATAEPTPDATPVTNPSPSVSAQPEPTPIATPSAAPASAPPSSEPGDSPSAAPERRPRNPPPSPPRSPPRPWS